MLRSESMEYRLGCTALVFALTGCFSDPPSSGSGSGGTTSSPTTGASTGMDTESSDSAADSSSGFGESSSTGGDSSSGSTGFDCELIEFEVPTVESDVVVLIDEGASIDAASLFNGVTGLLSPGTNVAILAHENEVPDLPFVDCDMGCGTCNVEPAMRILYPYMNSAVEALLETQEYSCILRDPPPGNPTTGPTKHLWMITDDPLQELPDPFADAVADLGLRVHLSCPMCDDNFGNVSGDLMNAVTSTFGTVSNSNLPNQVGEQADLIAASKVSCGWIPEEFPPAVFLALITDPDDPEVAFLSEVDEAGCTPDGYFARDVEGAPAPAVTLCPQPCTLAQTLPAGLVEIYGCY